MSEFLRHPPGEHTMTTELEAAVRRLEAVADGGLVALPDESAASLEGDIAIVLAALSTPPADDVREALTRSLTGGERLTPDEAMQHAHAIAVTRAPGRMTWGEALRHFATWMREHDDRLIAEVRSRGTVTDAAPEYGVRHISTDGWPKDQMHVSLKDALADLNTCGMNCYIIRRSGPGKWEPADARGEVRS